MIKDNEFKKGADGTNFTSEAWRTARISICLTLNNTAKSIHSVHPDEYTEAIKHSSIENVSCSVWRNTPWQKHYNTKHGLDAQFDTGKKKPALKWASSWHRQRQARSDVTRLKPHFLVAGFRNLNYLKCTKEKQFQMPTLQKGQERCKNDRKWRNTFFLYCWFLKSLLDNAGGLQEMFTQIFASMSWYAELRKQRKKICSCLGCLTPSDMATIQKIYPTHSRWFWLLCNVYLYK